MRKTRAELEQIADRIVKAVVANLAKERAHPNGDAFGEGEPVLGVSKEAPEELAKHEHGRRIVSAPERWEGEVALSLSSAQWKLDRRRASRPR